LGSMKRRCVSPEEKGEEPERAIHKRRCSGGKKKKKSQVSNSKKGTPPNSQDDYERGTRDLGVERKGNTGPSHTQKKMRLAVCPPREGNKAVILDQSALRRMVKKKGRVDLGGELWKKGRRKAMVPIE